MSANLRASARALAAQVRTECEYSYDRRRGSADRDWELEDPEGHALVIAVEQALAAPGPEIICICGSTRFIREMAVLGWLLEKEGAIVLGLHLLPDGYPGVQPDHQAEAEGVKEKMDELHLRKIDLSHRVIVVSRGGYIGESASREIAYAEATGKPVSYVDGSAEAST